MKRLTIDQQIKTTWGVWVYQGLTESSGFKCDGCGKVRTHLHEFLGYTVPQEAITNPGGFTYHALYGTECIKSWLDEIKGA